MLSMSKYCLTDFVWLIRISGDFFRLVFTRLLDQLEQLSITSRKGASTVSSQVILGVTFEIRRNVEPLNLLILIVSHANVYEVNPDG